MISTNAVGIVVLFLSVLGLEVAEDTVIELLAALTTIVSFGLMIRNQWNRPDTKGFFLKK